jgi:hypothetical protein
LSALKDNRKHEEKVDISNKLAAMIEFRDKQNKLKAPPAFIKDDRYVEQPHFNSIVDKKEFDR